MIDLNITVPPGEHEPTPTRPITVCAIALLLAQTVSGFWTAHRVGQISDEMVAQAVAAHAQQVHVYEESLKLTAYQPQEYRH